MRKKFKILQYNLQSIELTRKLTHNVDHIFTEHTCAI